MYLTLSGIKFAPKATIMKNLLLLIALSAGSALYAQASDSSVFYYSKGVAEKNAKRFQVADQAFEKSLKLNPSFVDAHIQQGYNSLEMRRTNQAMTSFSKVLELEPTNKTAIKELTLLYFSYRQWEKAISFARQCKDCENANKILGMSFYHQEDYPEAVKALTVSHNSNPNDPEVAYTLGRAFLDMEEYKKAVPYYEKAIKLDATKNGWMYELGLLYYNINEYKNALASFEKAAAAGYNQSNDFKENMGYAALYSGEYEKGENLLITIWQRKPGNKDILRDMADILYQQKQYDKSLGYCQKLMELDAKDGKALYQAGLNFIKKGQKDRGQQMCDKAIDMDPSLQSLRKKKEMPGMM